MSTTTTQKNFHSGYGHVADGTTIKMDNGDVLTLKAVMKGWQLFDEQGRPHSIPTNSAFVIDCLVFAYPSEEI